MILGQLSPNKRLSTGSTSHINATTTLKPTKQTNPRPKRPRKPKKVAGALPADNLGPAPGSGTPAIHSSQGYANTAGNYMFYFLCICKFLI